MGFYYSMVTRAARFPYLSWSYSHYGFCRLTISIDSVIVVSSSWRTFWHPWRWYLHIAKDKLADAGWSVPGELTTSRRKGFESRKLAPGAIWRLCFKMAISRVERYLGSCLNQSSFGGRACESVIVLVRKRVLSSML